jgi:hypothetical protein
MSGATNPFSKLIGREMHLTLMLNNDLLVSKLGHGLAFGIRDTGSLNDQNLTVHRVLTHNQITSTAVKRFKRRKMVANPFINKVTTQSTTQVTTQDERKCTIGTPGERVEQCRQQPWGKGSYTSCAERAEQSCRITYLCVWKNGECIKAQDVVGPVMFHGEEFKEHTDIWYDFNSVATFDLTNSGLLDLVVGGTVMTGKR